MNIRLQDLPIATAALDRDGVVVAANYQFMRLCGDADAHPFGQRLADFVAERDRAVVEKALHDLTILHEHGASQRCTLRALRARLPSLCLAISVAPLGPRSVAAYLACLQAISRRRRADILPNACHSSRRSAGSLHLTRQLLDLNPLVQRVVESTLDTRPRNVILTVTFAQTALPVDGDPGTLEQVVSKLLDHAITFTPEDGHLHVHTCREGSFATLVVSGNGIGITPDWLAAIGDPFAHGDGTIRPSERGLGLGLSLVRELVQIQDGDLRALSEGSDHGSTFIVRLPLASAVTGPMISRSRAASE